MTRRMPGLLIRILIAIVLGIACGLVFPDWLVRAFVTFDAVFDSFLAFVIPLVILGLIAPAISELGRGAGRWLFITTAIAYLSTLFAGLLGWGSGVLVLPRLLTGRDAGSFDTPRDLLMQPYFTVDLPPVLGVIPALVLAFVIGVALATTRGDALRRGFVEFREIVNKVVTAVIIPLLPLYVFGIFCNMTAVGQAWAILSTFLGVIVFVVAMTVVLLALQYAAAGIVTRRNPVAIFRTLLPAYVTALGTSSSVATIPVTLRQTILSGVSEPVASFVVPLCATVHLAGSAIKITLFSLAVLMLYGMPIDPWTFLGFIAMLGVTTVAAPGVPGGAIMTATGLLSSMLGFSEAQIGLMIAIYVAIDSFGTATNVTGDAAIAHVIDHLTARSLRRSSAQAAA